MRKNWFLKLLRIGAFALAAVFAFAACSNGGGGSRRANINDTWSATLEGEEWPGGKDLRVVIAPDTLDGDIAYVWTRLNADGTTETLSTEGETLFFVDDICGSEQKARALEHIFRRNQVALVHVKDVLEDWLV